MESQDIERAKECFEFSLDYANDILGVKIDHDKLRMLVNYLFEQMNKRSMVSGSALVETSVKEVFDEATITGKVRPDFHEPVAEAAEMAAQKQP